MRAHGWTFVRDGERVKGWDETGLECRMHETQCHVEEGIWNLIWG